jgi:hypothetical protein
LATLALQKLFNAENAEVSRRNAGIYRYTIMAGLDPAIHVVMQENSSKSICWRNAVDARLKAGHDNILSSRLASPSTSLSLSRQV